MKLALAIHRTAGAAAAAGVLLMLAAYFSALDGREAFAALFEHRPALATALALTVSLGLLGHLCAAIVLRAARSAGVYGSPTQTQADLTLLQRMAGWIALTWLLAHLGLAWRWGAALPIEAYAALRSDLPTLPVLVGYCIGATAFALHLGQGIERALGLPAAGERGRGLRIAVWGGISLLWAALAAVLSYFVTGTPAFWAF